jgi:hypothetical protein
MSDNLVTLGIYTTGIEAQMDKNFLESNGIAASVTEEAPLFPTVGNVLGSVKLLVSEDDARRAELVLASVHEEPELEKDEDAPKSEEFAATRNCPICGQSFDVELDRCPRCAPSEAFFEDDPARPRTNLAPLGPEDEVKDAPYSRGDEYGSRALFVSLLMIFFGGMPSVVLMVYARSMARMLGGLSLPMVISAVAAAILIQVVPHLYVFYLVIRFFFYEGEVRRSSEYKGIAAAIISGGICCLMLAVALSYRN